ncbi:hypothetical protein [Castellaniella sp.]|uniref:hypothetical protein n=1 Tax=Castellaniella sp. TaxID=1955812 RepID=UPI00356768FD
MPALKGARGGVGLAPRAQAFVARDGQALWGGAEQGGQGIATRTCSSVGSWTLPLYPALLGIGAQS